MKSFTKYLLATTFLVFLIPHVSFAASPAQAQQLSQELSQLQTTLATGISSTTFSLSPGQSIRQATSSDSKGILTITLPDFLHTNPDPTIPSVVSQQPVSYLAEIKLEYDPCIAAAPSVCISEASSSYPVMTSRLMQGQDTGYLNYLITPYFAQQHHRNV